jgi:hypothetical protein
MSKTDYILAPLLATVLSFGCKQQLTSEPSTGTNDNNTAISKTTRSIIAGTTTASRLEITSVTVDGGHRCAGILIAPRYVITASHCFYGYDVPWPNTAFAGIPVMWFWSFGTADTSAMPNAPFNNDLLLIRLTSAPAGLTPARIATSRPGVGSSVSQVGFGPSAGDCSGAVGTKRYKDYLFNPAQNHGCPGDSGGPLLWGSFASNGDVIGVYSYQAPAFGDAVKFREEIASVMREWEGGFENDLDRPGSDLPSMPITSTSAAFCRASCIANNQCVAFTWKTTNQCWLKSALPPWQACTNCVSGVNESRESVASTWEPSTNRNSPNFFQYSTTHDDCRAQCLKDSRCKAYTFASGTCYMKDHVPAPSVDSVGVFSGVRKVPQLNRLRNGTFLSQGDLSVATTEECAALCRLDASCKSYAYRRPEIGLKAFCRLHSNDPGASGFAWGWSTAAMDRTAYTSDSYGYY